MGKFRLRGRRRKNREPRPDRIPLRVIVPNLVTSLAACAGITSISLSSEGRFLPALWALLVACICDGMDGRIARLLKASSKLGAELDSLADFVNFGVAPAMLVYFWVTGGPLHLGCNARVVQLTLGCAHYYAMCDCFRLARFNTMLEQEPLPYWKKYFTGIPAPGGCWMVLTPVILSVQCSGWVPAKVCDALRSPYLGMAMLLFVGTLMASRLPTVSLKAIRLNGKRQMQVFMVVALLLIGALVADLWLTLGVMGCLYFLTVPMTGLSFLKARSRYERSLPAAASEPHVGA